MPIAMDAAAAAAAAAAAVATEKSYRNHTATRRHDPAEACTQRPLVLVPRIPGMSEHS